MDQEKIKLLSYIKSSSNRYKILDKLNNKIYTPSQIADKTSLKLNNISYYLNQLKTKGLIICLNENDKKGRLYQITILGKEILELVIKNV